MQNLLRSLLLLVSLLIFNGLMAQKTYTENVATINKPEDFSLLETNGKQVFFLAETQHALRRTPQLMLDILSYLHSHANTRILALEHGYSAAYLINEYLENGDSTLLRQISRNTMFWGKENYQFLKDLAVYNNQLPSDQKIIVKSIDVEYKAESAILVINQLMGKRAIPVTLDKSLGEFKRIYKEKELHQAQFDGINVYNYYDRKRVIEAINLILDDLKKNKPLFQEYFRDNYEHFEIIILGLYDGFVKFNAAKPNKNFKRRDDIIYRNFIHMMKEYPDTGIFCTIGNAHVLGHASGTKSPLKERSLTMMLYAWNLHKQGSGKLNQINKVLDNELSENKVTLIKHDKNSKLFEPSLKVNEYSIILKDKERLTSFKNSFR